MKKEVGLKEEMIGVFSIQPSWKGILQATGGSLVHHFS